MSFADRTGKSNQLIKLLNTHYWNHPTIIHGYSMFHEPYGYETHITPSTQAILRQIYSTTSKHIRFTPDYIAGRAGVQLQEPILLLEYKVTTTPRYTLGDKQWDSGQIEADAWENYMNLIKAGIVVALVIYCPYHSRPLLFEFPSDQWLTQARSTVSSSTTGSRTDYCNIAMPRLRTFTQFMEDQFMVPKSTSYPLITAVLNRARVDPTLQISHSPASIHKDRQSGFNWVV